MTYVALIVAVSALFLAWLANRKNAVLKERIAQANSRLYNLRREQTDLVRDLQTEINLLKYDVMHIRGETYVSGETTIDAITAMHPQAAEILAAFHIGGCSSCAVDDSQRLDVAAAQSNQPLKPILVALNALISQAQSPAEAIRVPNVHLNF